MTEDALHGRVRHPEGIEAPPFDPDPEIVGHLEGNRREIRRMKAFIVKFKAEVAAEHSKLKS
jgi:hypothetical protein